MSNIVRIIGDIHGKKYEYRLITENMPIYITKSIQLGDMGVGFGQNDYWHESLDEHMIATNGFFIRGNHDNPTVAKNMTNYINDGPFMDNTFILNGAWSIDWKYRIDGIDWWRDEELSYNELNKLIDIYSETKPRIMITHDCPTLAAYYMFIKEGKTLGGKTLHLTRTGEALQQMFEIHQPDFWFFGHWHHSLAKKINGTKFVCLDELDFIDVDLSDTDAIMKAVNEKFSKGV